MGNSSGLNKLEEVVCDQLLFLNYSAVRRTKNSEVYRVAIIGGGMAGTASALALLKIGIDGIQIFDQAPIDKEGPWATFARMKTLRTSKNWMGPSGGIPSLTFQAWYEAQYGAFAWQLLGNIPTSLWAEYLCWLKKILKLPIQNETKLLSIIPEGNYFKLILSNGVAMAEKIVLATGHSGFGGPEIPDVFQNAPKYLWAHTNEQIDFGALKGKRIAVIGGGDAGFDAAATALENGAERVELHIRRGKLPDLNLMHPFLLALNSGEYCLLSDEEKATVFSFIFDHGFSPPQEAFKRLEPFSNFYFHTNSTIKKDLGNFDFYILATGPCISGAKQLEISSFAEQILLWQDKGFHHARLGKYPYLGKNFEFLEKKKGDAPFLKNIYCLNQGSAISHGFLGTTISQISVGAQIMAQGIKNDFFLKEKDQQLAIFHRSKGPSLSTRSP